MGRTFMTSSNLVASLEAHLHKQPLLGFNMDLGDTSVQPIMHRKHNITRTNIPPDDGALH